MQRNGEVSRFSAPFSSAASAFKTSAVSNDARTQRAASTTPRSMLRVGNIVRPSVNSAEILVVALSVVPSSFTARASTRRSDFRATGIHLALHPDQRNEIQVPLRHVSNVWRFLCFLRKQPGVSRAPDQRFQGDGLNVNRESQVERKGRTNDEESYESIVV